MADGGLFDPVGTDRPDAPRRTGFPASVVMAGLATLALAILVAVAALRDDGDRGEPRASVPIVATVPVVATAPVAATVPVVATAQQPASVASAPPVALSPGPPSAAAAGGPIAPGATASSADQDVEIQNGVRIIRPRRVAPATGSQTILVPSSGLARP